MQIKKIIYLIAIILTITNLSSCYDSTEVDDMVYILAIGIDESSETENTYTFQAAVPLNISSGVETGFAEAEESVTVQNISVVANNLLSAIEIANGNLAKEINISHCKIVVFHKEIDSKIFKNNIITINSYDKFNTETLVAMCENKASDYLDAISSPFEKNPARYYSMYFKKGFSLSAVNTKISNFEKTAALALPLLAQSNKNRAVIIKDFKKTVELSEEETFALNIISGKFKKGYLSTNENNISAQIYTCSSKISVNTNNINPIFNIELKLQGKFFSDSANNNKHKEKIENYIKKTVMDYLEKSAKYNVDVTELIKHSRLNFLTTKAYQNYDLEKKFSQSQFNVIIDFQAI